MGALGDGASQFVSVDWDVEVRRSGWDALRDERLWYLARSRLGPAGWFALANRVRDYWLAYHGDARKVVAVDLDDTLWGGVVGEVGLQGIELGNEAIGLAFQDFQRELLKWNDAGVLLTIVSKNNAADALAVFDQHPGMILKRDHFAAMRINWQDKATSLRELAEELNVAIDSFVFLDDNPVEREWVRRALPGVVVPELPSELTARPDFLRRLTHFNRVAVTEADRKRLGSYRFQHKRRELQASAVSMSDYLSSLDQAVRFDPITPATLARAAQMCQRTNQFNLTTRRYTVADLQAMLADDRVEIVSLCVADRFEDYGIVGLAILRHAPQSAELDSFLMSCRVLGRRIEFDFLNEMVRRARARGAERLTGRYLSTAKNAQVVDFLNNAGVTLHSDGAFVVVGVENVH